jgi:DNA mismatch repair ATPase MutS
MDILVNEKRSSDDDLNDLHESTPLFKLRVGQAPDSEGINCAKQCNVQEDIIERAIAIKKCIKSKKSLPKRNFRSLQQGIHNIKNKEILKEFLSFDWSSEEVSDHKTSQFLQAMKMKLL